TLGSPVVATATIQNDDTQPVISIVPSVSSAEGNAGNTPFSFAVSLSNASSSVVSATYLATDGTATQADNDYLPASGTVTIPANSLSGSVTVNVVGDTKLEANETFTVTLSSPSGGTLGTAASTGTITNDDVPPVVSIDNVSQAEGNAGTTTYQFTVSLSQASGLPASVDFATADGTATLANNDYQISAATLNFAPGVTSQPIFVLVNGDATLEGNETFVVNLTNPVQLQAGTMQ